MLDTLQRAASPLAEALRIAAALERQTGCRWDSRFDALTKADVKAARDAGVSHDEADELRKHSLHDDAQVAGAPAGAALGHALAAAARRGVAEGVGAALGEAARQAAMGSMLAMFGGAAPAGAAAATKALQALVDVATGGQLPPWLLPALAELPTVAAPAAAVAPAHPPEYNELVAITQAVLPLVVKPLRQCAADDPQTDPPRSDRADGAPGGGGGAPPDPRGRDARPIWQDVEGTAGAGAGRIGPAARRRLPAGRRPTE